MKSASSPRILSTLALSLLVAGSAALLAGCGSETSAAGAASAPAAVTSSGPPTLSELTAAVDLSANQGTEITPPLERWHTQDGRMRQARQAGNFERDENFEPPVMSFLMDSAPILDHAQFLSMVSFLATRQEQAREQRMARVADGQGPGRGMRGEGRGGPGQGRPGQGGPRHGKNGDGPGFGGGQGGGPGFALMKLVRDLNLDDATKAQVQETAKTHMEAMKALAEQHRAGDITDEAFRDRAKTLRGEFETALAAVLGAENFAKFQELKNEQRVKFAERGLEKLGDGIDRRVAFLTKVLDLDETQVAQVTDVLKSGIPAMQALLTSLRDGGLDMEDFLYQSKQLRDAGKEALRGVLNAEQIETLDALEALRPGRGHRGRRG